MDFELLRGHFVSIAGMIQNAIFDRLHCVEEFHHRKGLTNDWNLKLFNRF